MSATSRAGSIVINFLQNIQPNEGAGLHEEEADLWAERAEHKQQGGGEQKPPETVQLPDAE